MQSLVTWFNSHKVNTHLVALLITFCITTFATSVDFRDGCIAIWQAFNHAMQPHPIAYLFVFKLGIPLTVTLWGWYRNGQSKTIIDASVAPAAGTKVIETNADVRVSADGKTTNS